MLKQMRKNLKKINLFFIIEMAQKKLAIKKTSDIKFHCDEKILI